LISIIIRDLGQIYLLGILFPLVFIQRAGENWREYGLSLRKWPIYLLINTILGVLLLFMFLSESPPPADFHLDRTLLWSGSFVLLALCFELIFFYAFLRTLLERAFGIIPAIILTATFYAFHHAGFQPEYGKMFLVGLLYATIYRLGNSALLIFPFFLGVGGTYDVLIQSQVVDPILFPQIRTICIAIAVLTTMIYIWKKQNRNINSCQEEK